ncbi:MAG: ribonuclease R [Prevotellaceae bacterium]|jgi:ribonuclease R|nr:ribonuclease R [Prevotellaceae bacterium]
MSKKKKKKSIDFLQSIINVFEQHPSRQYTCREVAALVNPDSELRKILPVAVDGLVVQGVLENPAPGKYIFKKPEDFFLVGTVDITRQGSAYITPESDDSNSDIFVAEHNMNRAFHGDKVKIRVFNKKSGRMEGEVVEIIDESKRSFVGKIEISNKYAFVIPDSKNLPYDIFIPLTSLKNAQSGQKVVVRIVEWKKGMKNPTGEVIDVLGESGSNDVEMHAILAEFDLPYSYPANLEKAANRISEKIPEAEYAKRRDFRNCVTFTIDPKDAKDFDDALSISLLDNGNWEIGVHIADVTHYVKPNTSINQEAESRATSIYLVDRTIPMLPERLSNFICSLRPDEEKLCFSAVFEMDSKASIKNEWFGRTVILSKKRFTYEEAQTVIETGAGDYAKEVLKLNELAQILRKKRFRDGAITFEREEPRFEIDENGKPVSVYFKEIKESNQLIEEFMLLANKKVAEKIGKKVSGQKAKTFVYRIHDKPDTEKLNKFGDFIKRFGYSMKLDDDDILSKEMNKILAQVKGKPESGLIETLAVRSMAKAIYTVNNLGHYGLAFPFYTHFTSPIRRYPDMMVHRLLAKYLGNGKSADKDYYEEMCRRSSAMEQRAAEAERASIKYKMIEFMQDKIGEEYEGLVTGVTEWGIYVEIIENKVEGMVSVRSMKDDCYYFDEDNYRMVGQSSGITYTLGDKVHVKLVNADLMQKHIDFQMINPEFEDYMEKRHAVKNGKKKKEKKEKEKK